MVVAKLLLGSRAFNKLTMDTMNTLREGISLNKFDPTIRDAILVTRALEITYIWIDALCIVQDDNVEWNEQASRMIEIYGGSTVTLIVASAPSVMDGFLDKRKLQYFPIVRSTAETGNTQPAANVFFSPEWDESEDEPNGPWSNRGWTMQEGILPSRMLHYTSSQMVWKCGEELRFERGVIKSLQDEAAEFLTYSDLLGLDGFIKFKRFAEYLPGSLDYPLLSEPETFYLWYDLIEEYTQRTFTYFSGRLLEISAIVKIFGNTIRSQQYVAGLWKPDLIRGLL